MGFQSSISAWRDTGYSYNGEFRNIKKAHSVKNFDEEPAFLKEGLISSSRVKGNLSAEDRNEFAYAGFCGYSDMYHGELLNPKSQYYQRGYLVRVKGNILGQIKLKGDRSFLAWRSVERYPGKLSLIFGCLYKIPNGVNDLVYSLPKLKSSSWGILDLPNIKFEPRRFIVEKTPSLLTILAGDSIRERIRKERKRVEDNLASNRDFYSVFRK